MSPGNAYLLTKVLEQVIQRGTGTAAQIDRPAAGKTGTTNDYVDAWFAGYTPDLVAAVWVGYPQGKHPDDFGARHPCVRRYVPGPDLACIHDRGA